MSLNDEPELNQHDQMEEIDETSDGIEEVEKEVSGDENAATDNASKRKGVSGAPTDSTNGFVIPSVSKGTFCKFDPSRPEYLATNKLPLARLKRVLKEDKSFQGASGEAYTALAKAAEMFIRCFAVDSYNLAAQDKRLTVAYKDCASAVSSTERYEFLTEVVPSTMSFSKALVSQKQELLKKSSLANGSSPPEAM